MRPEEFELKVQRVIAGRLSLNGGLSGKAALDALRARIFGNLSEGHAGILTPKDLIDLGVYVGGFVHLNNTSEKVKYQFWGPNQDDIQFGESYVLPYVWADPRNQEEARLSAFCDALFYFHRSHQANHIWQAEPGKEHLVPEFLAKAPFFVSRIPQKSVPSPILYVPFLELWSVIFLYRVILEHAWRQSNPPANELEFWEAMPLENLSEFERSLCKAVSGPQSDLQSACRWSLAKISDPIAGLQRLGYKFAREEDLAESLRKTAQLIGVQFEFSRTTGQSLIRQVLNDGRFGGGLIHLLHRASRFPVLPYLYWNLLEPEAPKTHAVVPLWQDFTQPPAGCLEFGPDNGPLKHSETRTTIVAVLSVRPGEIETGEGVNSLTAATVLSSVISEPQIAATYYGERFDALRRAAIASVSAASLSHNIGSHALSDPALFDPADEQDCAELKVFNNYLQARMDYVAQLISPVPPEPEPLYLFQDVLADFLRQRLLLDRLTADRGIVGADLEFIVIFPSGKQRGAREERRVFRWRHIIELARDGKMRGPESDVLVAIPGGTVGKHALYTILENVLRNSVKYGDKDEEGRKRRLSLTLRLRDPGPGDFWVLEISDNRSGFSEAEEAEDDSPSRRGAFIRLCDGFERDVAAEDGRLAEGGHGLVEIKEAMRFLHPHEKSPEYLPRACRHCRHPAVRGRPCCVRNVANVWEGGRAETRGTLAYRVHLARPMLLAVWCPGIGQDAVRTESEGVIFSGWLTNAEGDGSALAELSSFLLVLLDSGVGEASAQVRELAAEQWRLPFRLLIVSDKPERAEIWRVAIEAAQPWKEGVASTRESTPVDPGSALPRGRVRVAVDENLHAILRQASPARRSPRALRGLALVNLVYDRWLSTYKPKAIDEGGKWHLVVHFDRPGQNAAPRWVCAKKFNDWAASVSISVYAQKAAYGRAYLAVGKELEKSKVPAGHIVHFGNHGKIPYDYLRDMDERRLAFSQSFGAKFGPRTFSALYTPPTELEAFKFFALGLVEAALTSIAVFDERLLGSILDAPGKSKLRRFSEKRIADARTAGIIPVVALRSSDRSGFAFARPDTEWGRWVPKPEDEPIEGICTGYDKEFLRQAESFPQTDEAVDALVLHEGLVEELNSRGKLAEGFELSLIRFASRVIRTSGKGPEARKLDKRLPFCEYSGMSACISPITDVNELISSRDGKTARGDASKAPQGDELRLRIEKLALARAVLNSCRRQ